MTSAKRCSSTRGFSLIELLVAVAVLTVILAAVVRLAQNMVRTNDRVSASVDTVQQGRQFMDQVAADIHMSGFPNYAMINHSNNSGSTASQYWAGNAAGTSQSGVLSATTTQLQFEGDIDNSGTISQVVLQLCVTGTNCTAPAANSDCPCTMRRGTVSKLAAMNSGATPAYYTELSNVMNWDVFKYWTYNGVAWDSSSMGLDNLRTVEVKLQVRAQNKDLQTNSYPVITLDSEVKLSNY